ncbi:hypothetical protein GALMADRAFT_142200 [Galerina marginata CBS 339.88]|uniref:Uncharacterized protein n=1 Tax=Galerina marginata (strain CBS 339.88) TaxID=685588 RepID=A0A067T1C7_GALM3|nr:hypothetical protein GALMADRAFT_142200 [Galerina marginata CBS 339.88]
MSLTISLSLPNVAYVCRSLDIKSLDVRRSFLFLAVIHNAYCAHYLALFCLWCISASNAPYRLFGDSALGNNLQELDFDSRRNR